MGRVGGPGTELPVPGHASPMFFFLRLASSDRPKFLAFSKKKKIGNDVFKTFLCRIGVSVVDPFSHTILILQQHPSTFPPN